jgi:hypothetical protein
LGENVAAPVKKPEITAVGIQKLELTSMTNDGCSVIIIRSRTQAMEFSFFSLFLIIKVSLIRVLNMGIY